MNRRRGGLGSGLDALIPAETRSENVRELPVSSIRQNPRQPRTFFDPVALADLVASIREHGIIQPLIVSEREAGQYELIAGERRWRAAQQAGVATVPVVVRETTPQQLLELALIENVQRADLNPLEEARAYQSLKEEFGLSDDQIAQRLGKHSRVSITNTRRLLKLTPQAQEAIIKSQISAGHGRALLKCENPDLQNQALDAMVAYELSVREAEQLGDSVAAGSDIATAIETLRGKRTDQNQRGQQRASRRTNEPPATLSPDDYAIQREMEGILGTPVKIVRTTQDLRVTIVFHTDEKLEEFFSILNAK